MTLPTVVYLAINPAWQNKGLGTLICKILEKLVSDKGSDSLYVQDPTVKGFYTRLGFQVIEDNLLLKSPLTERILPELPHGYSYSIQEFDKWDSEPFRGIFLRLAENDVVIGKGRIEWRNDG